MKLIVVLNMKYQVLYEISRPQFSIPHYLLLVQEGYKATNLTTSCSAPFVATLHKNKLVFLKFMCVCESVFPKSLCVWVLCKVQQQSLSCLADGAGWGAQEGWAALQSGQSLLHGAPKAPALGCTTRFGFHNHHGQNLKATKNQIFKGTKQWRFSTWQPGNRRVNPPWTWR